MMKGLHSNYIPSSESLLIISLQQAQVRGKPEGLRKEESTSRHVETTLDGFIVYVALNFFVFGGCAIRRWCP